MSKKNPLILNIESATDVCSIALSCGSDVLAIAESEEKMAHSKVMTLLIQQCLEKANKTLKDIDAIGLSKGPGSYTSLRVGSSVAKGICYALNKPLVAVDTLQSLALACAQKNGDATATYVPMIDARRMEVYTAQFTATGAQIEPISAKIISEDSYADIFASEKKLVFCGNGAEKCQSVLLSPYAHFAPSSCKAIDLVPLSLKAYQANKFEDIAYFEPEYFKAPNITKSKKKLL